MNIFRFLIEIDEILFECGINRFHFFHNQVESFLISLILHELQYDVVNAIDDEANVSDDEVNENDDEHDELKVVNNVELEEVIEMITVANDNELEMQVDAFLCVIFFKNEF